MNWIKKIFGSRKNDVILESSTSDSLFTPTPTSGPVFDNSLPLIKVDIFSLLGERQIAGGVKMIFDFTRNVVGGCISLIDIEYENGVELKNVRIQDEHEIEIPCNFEKHPIKSVSVPNFERQMAYQLMYARKK
jgi:hypothetical protein